MEKEKDGQVTKHIYEDIMTKLIILRPNQKSTRILSLDGVPPALKSFQILDNELHMKTQHWDEKPDLAR